MNRDDTQGFLKQLENHNEEVLLALIEKHLGPDSITLQWANEQLRAGATASQITLALISELSKEARNVR